MRILVTGANGFIGRNLAMRLKEEGHEVVGFTRTNCIEELVSMLSDVDGVFHLAGENRPKDPECFERVNVDLTKALADAIIASGRDPVVVFSSSTQASLNTLYGQSKLAAEAVLEQLAGLTNASVSIYRLPGVFGKWGLPNYNSVVNTFCYNMARGLPVRIDDPDRFVTLVHVDDVVSAFLSELSLPRPGLRRPRVSPEYKVTLGALHTQIDAFGKSRETLITERVGSGLTRALYATYVSYLPTEAFRYTVPAFSDERGIFVEVLKTWDAGQFSFFTAHPNVTRGGHYHHSKTEKFLVLRGSALFRFHNISTGERLEICTSGGKPEIIETVPGWAHDITNIGTEDLIVMLWANELFDQNRPDTIASEL